MSGGVNGFEPPTDYGSKRSDLPFIPPPDYAKTMKFVKNPNREMNGHVIVPQPPPRQRPNLNGMANGDRISPEPMELPREQQNGNPKERILRMLQKQGVPVFPGLASKQEAVIEKPEPPSKIFGKKDLKRIYSCTTAKPDFEFGPHQSLLEAFGEPSELRYDAVVQGNGQLPDL